jgi:TolB protein
VLSFLCLIGSGCALIGFGKQRQEQRPPVPARAAYVAEDGHVYTIDLAGGVPRRVSQIDGQVAGETTKGREAPTARWPTWAPDAARLAFVRVLVTPADVLAAAQVWTVAHDGSELRKVWESTDREPIYLAWSPDGRQIALLVQSTDDLELLILDVSGTEPARRVAIGNPFYFVWSADSTTLFLHVGSDRSGTSKPELFTIRLGPPDEVRSLGIVPGDFRTPAWSADGRTVVFIANGPDDVPMLSLIDPRGGDMTRLAAVPGQTAFALSRDGNRIAWGSRSETDRLAYDGLEVVSTDGRKRVRVTNDPVVAFFWSPTDQRIAFMTIEQSGQTVTWHVADADGNHPRRLVSFVPTLEQIRLLAFFDQYATSHGLWSPDGESLVYAVGIPGENRVFGEVSPGIVSSVSIGETPSTRRVASGSFVSMPVPSPAP